MKLLKSSDHNLIGNIINIKNMVKYRDLFQITSNVTQYMCIIKFMHSKMLIIRQVEILYVYIYFQLARMVSSKHWIFLPSLPLSICLSLRHIFAINHLKFNNFNQKQFLTCSSHCDKSSYTNVQPLYSTVQLYRNLIKSITLFQPRNPIFG